MLNVELRPLLRRLSPYCRRALNEAAEGCIERGNHEISLEHLMLALLSEPNHDVHCVLRHYNIDGDRVVGALQRQIERSGGGHAERPIYSRLLVDLIQQAWLLASIEYGHTEVRSGALLLAMAVDSQLIAQLNCDELDAIAVPALRKNFMDVLDYSAEPVSQSDSQGSGSSADFNREGTPLDLYTQDFTAQARAGEIDPIFCRDNEIRQLIDILGRRRKNNPLAVGEAGVGKTALIEGLARRIAEGDVPDSLLNVDLLALDLQAMQAGASVKGEFEKRLKGVVEGVKASPKPIVLFIDEVHTLIGAGGSAGTGDAANILKPALARGELRTIAATTWSEYKKYIEKDAALARRFQLVKLEEPSPAQAVVIMRGLRKIYENAHNVYIRDDAVVAAAEMSARYISGRQLPDKAVDVLDTASARVKLSISAKPAALDDLEKSVQVCQREHRAIARDVEAGVSDETERLTELDEEMVTKGEQIELLRDRWQKEKALAEQILALRGKLSGNEDSDSAADVKKEGDSESESETESDGPVLSDEEIRAELAVKTEELSELQDGDPLVSHEAGPDVVAKVIADWTGIPVGKMVRDQARMILEFQQQLGQRVKGQDHAVEAIDMGVRASKAGVANPDAPIGVFLLVGPSGVGKTETALGVADLMFGGERFVTTVNMSEFMEKHTVSRLIGSPPGYVDSDKGGMLTEAVKQRPYSVVLLDEVEKAHPDVLNLFYQLFDKGELSDGQNLTVNFRNTIVFLTSNLGSDQIMSMWRDNADVSTEDISEQIRPTLAKHFKQALLARMNVVPFFPLGDSVLRDIVDIKLGKLVRRLQESQRISLVYSDAVADQIVARCHEVETGARNIDYVINSTLIPSISTEVLSRMNDEKMPDTLHIDLSSDGNFTYTFRLGQTEI